MHPTARFEELPPSLAADTSQLKFIVNPNSPTGPCSNRPARGGAQRLDRRGRDRRGVRRLRASILPLAPRVARHLLILRTFSKSYGLAGLRIGFAVGPPDLIADLAAVGKSYPVDRCAVAGALAALEDTEHHRRIVDEVVAERSRVSASLAGMGWSVTPSHANFVCAVRPRGRRRTRPPGCAREACSSAASTAASADGCASPWAPSRRTTPCWPRSAEAARRGRPYTVANEGIRRGCASRWVRRLAARRSLGAACAHRRPGRHLRGRRLRPHRHPCRGVRGHGGARPGRRRGRGAVPFHGRRRQHARAGGRAHRQRGADGRPPSCVAAPSRCGSATRALSSATAPCSVDAAARRCRRAASWSATPTSAPTPSASRWRSPRSTPPACRTSRWTSATPPSSPRCSQGPASTRRAATEIGAALAARDLVAVETRARRRPRSGPAEHALLLRFPALRGGRELLEQARAAPGGGGAGARPRRSHAALGPAHKERPGIGQPAQDLGAVRDWNCCTGPTFEGSAGGLASHSGAGTAKTSCWG